MGLVSSPEERDREGHSGWGNSDKGTHLLGLCVPGLKALAQEYRALDSFLVTAPELLAEDSAQNTSAGCDTGFSPGKQASQALLWLLTLPSLSSSLSLFVPPGKPNLWLMRFSPASFPEGS